MADPAALAPAATDAGAMERLFLVETRSPAYPDYESADSLKAMRVMRQVIENRLKSPAQWGARGATSETEVIAVGTQFAGFGGYPQLSADLNALIASILKLAGASGDARQAKYAGFVQNAITAATEKPAVEPTYAEASAWRTHGHSAPGRNFRLLVTLQGNDFYAVTPVPPMPTPHHNRHARRQSG